MRRASPALARLAAMAAVAGLGACAGAAPAQEPPRAPLPLSFAELDYGFPVRYAGDEPRVAYVDLGTGPRTLVLVHGLASNLGFWRYNIPALAAKHRVIAVDLPGYGRSAKSTAYDYSLTAQAARLAALLRELGLETVTLVGHSMGGQIAMVAALHHPELVDRLVLVDPAGIEAFTPAEAELLRNAYTVEGIRTTPEQGVRRNFAANFHRWDDHLEWMVDERLRLARTDEFDLFADAVVKSVAAMLDEPTAPLLEQIAQPTLIVFGEEDALIPNPYLHPGRAADVFAQAHARIPRSALAAIQQAGHLSMMERPDAFNRLVLDWLRR